MSSYQVLDTTGTAYTFYEIEKRQETIGEKTRTKKTNRKGKRKKCTRYIYIYTYIAVSDIVAGRPGGSSG